MNIFKFSHACGSIGYGSTPEGAVDWAIGDDAATIDYPLVHDGQGELIGRITSEELPEKPYVTAADAIFSASSFILLAIMPFHLAYFAFATQEYTEFLWDSVFWWLEPLSEAINNLR